MNEYRQTAEAIIAAVGGKENIAAATHCATRLRMVLKDENKIDKAAIDTVPLAKGNFLTAGQFQLILGTGTVNKVTAELLDITGVKQVSTQEAKDLGAAKGNLLQRFVKTLSDIFVPIIPAIVAGGLLMGLNNVLTAHDLIIKGKSIIEAYPQWAGLASMINSLASAPFVFLPVLIGFSSARIFGGNPFLGAALGMMMVHTDLTSNYNVAEAIAKGELRYWDLFGHPFAQIGYQGTVLPILVSSWILAKLEKYFRRIIPASLDLLLTPLLSLLITGLLTYTIVGPFTRDAGVAFTDAVQWLYNTADSILAAIAYQSGGDARKAIGWLEEWALLRSQGASDEDALAQALADQPKALDKQGDWFYELLSAFHKSLRGSNPDGAMYWFARMVDGGADPLVIARRMLCVRQRRHRQCRPERAQPRSERLPDLRTPRCPRRLPRSRPDHHLPLPRAKKQRQLQSDESRLCLRPREPRPPRAAAPAQRPDRRAQKRRRRRTLHRRPRRTASLRRRPNLPAGSDDGSGHPLLSAKPARL